MTAAGGDLEIFLMAAPGLEPALYAEARAKGFRQARIGQGGVTVRGGWPEVWRANLELRGAGRVVAGIASFRVSRLDELEGLARRVPWPRLLRADVPFRVEATCKASRIYHSGAVEERIANAIVATLGAAMSADAAVCIRVRLDNDVCSIGIDTSGEALHKRGHKQAVNAAPMRETMAALILRQCGFTEREPVVDPMCGSGTFVIEAAEAALRTMPGRERSFAFEQLATFDVEAWSRVRAARMRLAEAARAKLPADVRFHGSDRDAGAVAMSRANAERAGLGDVCEFRQHSVSDLERPPGPPGLVVTNPPYGTRLGATAKLAPLYRAFGETVRARFSGWRVGLVTTDAGLARATGLPFAPSGPPIAHGGLRVTLFQTGPLP